MTKKSRIIALVIVVLLIVAVVLGMVHKKSVTPLFVEKDGMKTYTEKDFGFTVTFPSDWVLEDQLTGERCCLFIAHIETSTSTAPNASGTPVETITQRELIKLQIGNYDRRILDPFATSTRSITLGGKTFHAGYTSTGEYFLLPRDEYTGIGAAEFRYTDTPPADIVTAQKIVGSITFTGTTPTVRNTPATSTAATSTKK